MTPHILWNPNTDAHSKSEHSIMDHKVKMIENKDRISKLMSDIEENTMMDASVVISKDESSLINRLCHESHSEKITIHGDLTDLLYNGGRTRIFKMSIGSTNLLSNDNLDDVSIGIAVTKAATDISDVGDSLEVNDDLENMLFDQTYSFAYEVIASDSRARDHKSGSFGMFCKIWKIDRETAEKPLEVAAQRVCRSDIPSLSRSYPKNNRILRHNLIDDLLFADAFFNVKKTKKPSMSNSCSQLFEICNRFAHATPMRSKI
jgi:hypothetical protein